MEDQEKHDPEAFWLAQLCTRSGYLEPRLLGDGKYVAIMPLMFTHAIILGQIGNDFEYQDRWCYKDFDAASRALSEWDGTGEPTGWHRHPNTGRRRKPDGTEEVNF